MKFGPYVMATKKIRVILDTNWYVSATINKKSRRIIYELLTNKNLTILFSNEILKEFNQVIIRPKFKNIINQQQVTRFINLIIYKIENIEIKSTTEGSRDPNDNFLLSLCVDGKADYLLTGDMDLLILQKIDSTQIITLSNFLAITSPQTQ
jgi:putative PIN family toxin of toxin-antitoxin system